MKTIQITPAGIESLEMILIYLSKNWSIKEHNDFVDAVIKTLKFIRRYPKLFPRYSNQVRRAIISKQIAMFYIEKGRRVDVLLFWNMRQDPSKLKL